MLSQSFACTFRWSSWAWSWPLCCTPLSWLLFSLDTSLPPCRRFALLMASCILVSSPRAGRLPLIAMFKYFISLNPRNYIRWNPNPRSSQPQTRQERVDRELLRFFQRELVPRETYRKGIRLITHGRIDQLPWISPSSLVFFPVFGVLYFFAFRQVNKRLSETRFVRGANLTPISQMKQSLAQAISEEKQVTQSFCRYSWACWTFPTVYRAAISSLPAPPVLASLFASTSTSAASTASGRPVLTSTSP